MEPTGLNANHFARLPGGMMLLDEGNKELHRILSLILTLHRDYSCELRSRGF